MWGVRITFFRPISGLSKGSALVRGSSGKTSSAAPPIRPAPIAWARAPMSTTWPRDRFSSSVPGFIRDSWAAPIRLAFSLRPSTCRLTTSLSASRASRLRMRRALPSASRSDRSWKTTRMPRASASTDSCDPMAP